MAYGTTTGRTWNISKSGQAYVDMTVPHVSLSTLEAGVGLLDGWQDPTLFSAGFNVSLRSQSINGLTGPNQYRYVVSYPGGTDSISLTNLPTSVGEVTGRWRISWSVTYGVKEYRASYVNNYNSMALNASAAGFPTTLFTFGHDTRDVFYMLLSGAWNFSYTIEWPGGSYSNSVSDSGADTLQIGYTESFLSSIITASDASLNEQIRSHAMTMISNSGIYTPTFNRTGINDGVVWTENLSNGVMTYNGYIKPIGQPNGTSNSMRSGMKYAVQSQLFPFNQFGDPYPRAGDLETEHVNYYIEDDEDLGTTVQRSISGLTHSFNILPTYDIRFRNYNAGEKRFLLPYVSDYMEHRFFLRPSSLTTVGETSSDVSLFWTGNQRKYFDLVHNDKVIDECTSLTGWAVTNAGTSLTQSGSKIIITGPGGGPGKVTRTFTTAEKTFAFRFLDVLMRSVGSANQSVIISLAIASGTPVNYTLTSDADGNWTTERVDMCNPDGLPSAPFCDEGSSLVMNGMDTIKTLAVTVPAGVTVEIDTFSLVAVNKKITFLPTAHQETLNNYTALYSNVDGRIASMAFTELGMFGLPTSIPNLGGWATSNIATLDGRYPICGIEWPEDGNAFDLDIASSTAIQQFQQIYRVQLHPNWGSYWKDGELGNTIILEASKILGSSAHGLVFDDNGPRSGETITLQKVSPVAARGDGDSDSVGYYKTDSDTARNTETLVCKHSSVSSSSFVTAPRSRKLKSFIVVPSESANPDNMSFGFGYYVRVDKEGDNIMFRFAVSPTAPFSSETIIDDSGDGDNPQIAFYYKLEQFLCVYELAGDVVIKTSTTFGETWSTEMALFETASFSEIWQGSDLAVVGAFRYNSGTSGPGKIYTRVRQFGKITWEAEVEVDAGDFEPGKFGLTVSNDAAHAIVLTATLSGETSVKEFISYDLGDTWEEKV